MRAVPSLCVDRFVVRNEIRRIRPLLCRGLQKRVQVCGYGQTLFSQSFWSACANADQRRGSGRLLWVPRWYSCNAIHATANAIVVASTNMSSCCELRLKTGLWRPFACVFNLFVSLFFFFTFFYFFLFFFFSCHRNGWKIHFQGSRKDATKTLKISQKTKSR